MTNEWIVLVYVPIVEDPCNLSTGLTTDPTVSSTTG